MTAPLTASDLTSIVHAGVRAPSADNQHCFKVHRDGDSLLLTGNEDFQAAPYHKKILGLISFGAVVENMSVRAAQRGYQTRIQWYPDAPRRSLVARLEFTVEQARNHALDAAIATRHTNRRVLFRGPRLSQADQAIFNRLAAEDQGAQLDFLDDAEPRSRLLRLMRIAEAERFNTPAMHHDLFSAVRFDVGWHTSAAIGLPPAALAVEPGARWAFAQLRRWSVMNGLRKLGFHHLLGFRAAYLPCRLAPHVGVLSTHLSPEDGAPLIGRLLERVWLTAEMQGLAFQPFAGAALLALGDYRDVPASTGDTLRRGWSTLLGERVPLMVFRLGHAKRPLIRSSRPNDLAAYLAA